MGLLYPVILLVSRLSGEDASMVGRTLSVRRSALEDRCTTTGGEVLFYRRSTAADAAGPPIVLVHGVGVSGTSVEPTATRLALDCDVLVPDLPGFGRSSSGAPYLDTASLADALARWLCDIDLDPAVIVGSSYGCQVAVELAVDHADRVARLVLASPTVDPAAASMPRQTWRWLRNYRRERNVQSSSSTTADWQRAGLRRVAATGRECVRHPMSRRLPLVHRPTLVVRGSGDVIVPQRWAEEAAALVPGASVAVVDGAAHSVVYTHPLEVATLIERFVGEG